MDSAGNYFIGKQATMSSVECLREFVNERLSAAAEEIFGVFKRTIVEYQEEIERQRGLLDVFWKPEVRLHRIELPPSRVCKHEEVLSDQERNPSLDQEDPGPPQIKEEQEELCTSQEGEQLEPKQEADTFTLTPTGEETDQAGRRLAFKSPSTPLGCDQQLSASPQTEDKKLLIAISGLSRQLNQHAADMDERLTQLQNSVNPRLLYIEEKLAALESNNCAGETNSKKRRRVHNPKLAETVRRLHNSETKGIRYEPEQGLMSPHNEAVTSYLLGAISASPDLHDVDKDNIVSACKTYYETVRRSFRFTQPENSLRAEAAKSSARSRARRRRLLESRQSVLADDEVELWNSATVDLMSDEEEGIVDGVSGWIVRSPSFRRPELSELCAKLQSRLEASPKYRATHNRRLHNGPASERTAPVTYNPEEANGQFIQL